MKWLNSFGEKETIYKEEVDLIMKGEPVESILLKWKKKPKERKKKEEKAKAERYNL